LLTRFPWFRSGLGCLLPVALSIFPASAIAAQAQTQAPLLAGIAHAAIRVSDLTKSRDFYEKLGFEAAFVMSKGGTTTEAFLKVNDRQFIEMYPQQQPSQAIGFMHVCFESIDLEELNRDYLARGLSPTPVKRAGAGNLLFTMVGPEQQNIEYTEYMPGSMHSNDRGKHLGTNRISEEIVGLSLVMEDPAAAQAFYEQKLGFRFAHRAVEPGLISLEIPGRSGQMVEIASRATSPAFQLLFSVSDLRRAAAQLKALHLPVEKQESMVSVQDPDGNRIVFVKVKPK
jgi:catechol 2,3-dioxygenase-like lactoylglutathione lyase family enzyme